jgi:hypothetical protein
VVKAFMSLLVGKFLALLILAILLNGCSTPSRGSLPYHAWRLGFFVPDYMEAWIETADAYGVDGIVRSHAGSGSPAMTYPRVLRKAPPNSFRGDPKGWPERVGWGAGKYVNGAALPKQIYVRWQSWVEPQIYHTRIDIPESIRGIMLRKENVHCQLTGKIEVRYRKAIVIGLAPGGIAKPWVTGPCLEPIEVARVQAKVDPTGPNDGLSNGKFDPPSAESRAYIEKFGIPYGSW